jgi:hypothetical protein
MVGDRSEDAAQVKRLVDLDALVDEMSIESFPASDPPSTWAGLQNPVPDSDRILSQSV